MRLLTDWKSFNQKINDFIEQADKIKQDFKTSNSNEDYVMLRHEVKAWQQKVDEYLSNSFDDKNNEFARGIRHPRQTKFNVGGRQKDDAQLVKDELDKLYNVKRNLEFYLKILSVSDAIIRPEEIDVDIRKEFTTEETLDLLLEKLYELYDDSYYPVSNILFGNAIELKRHDEERQLANRLDRLGYVNLQSAKYVYAQLTVEGKMYVENKLKKQTTDYSKINDSQEELSKKIDEIIEVLNKQNLGQELLFNELQELKELNLQLSKKNFGQVLKGKLLDLTLGQVINMETAKFVFKELTDQVFMLQ